MTGCRQIAFIPQSGSTFNDGYGLSMEYHLLEGIEFTLDYSELIVLFPGRGIRLRGTGLKLLFQQIRDHAIDHIEQTEPMDQADDHWPYRVTSMSRVE